MPAFRSNLDDPGVVVAECRPTGHLVGNRPNLVLLVPGETLNRLNRVEMDDGARHQTGAGISVIPPR